MVTIPPSRFALIFDMDGVVVDNTKYHTLAWRVFFTRYGKKLTTDGMKKHILGRLNKEILGDLLGKKLTPSEVDRLAEAKEALYRRLYAKAIRPVAGLPKFLARAHAAGIPIALATAAPPSNVRWVLRKTKLAKYFRMIVDGSNVRRGKPHPDIFLKCAKRLRVAVKNCIVFEDGMFGITAARRAGMKVVGVATTHKPSELRHTDLVIKNFKGLALDRLQNLF